MPTSTGRDTSDGVNGSMPPLGLLAGEGCLHLEVLTDAELDVVRSVPPGDGAAGASPSSDEVLAEALRGLMARGLVVVDGDDLRAAGDLAVFLGAVDAADRLIFVELGTPPVAETPSRRAIFVGDGFVLEDRMTLMGLHHAVVQTPASSILELASTLFDDASSTVGESILQDEAEIEALIASARHLGSVQAVWRAGNGMQATSILVAVSSEGTAWFISARTDLDGMEARVVDRDMLENALLSIFGVASIEDAPTPPPTGP